MSKLFQTVYKEGDFKGIVDIFKEYDDSIVEEREIFGNRVMIDNNDGYSEAELMIRFFPENAITIARICVNHKGKGIGSKIIEFIIDYAKSNNLSAVYIEQILSKEMIFIAEKYNFTPLKGANYKHDDGYIYGTYELQLV